MDNLFFFFFFFRFSTIPKTMTSEIQLRSATLDDVAVIIRAIEEIVSVQGESHYWTDAVEQELEQRTRENVVAAHAAHRVLVAEAEGRVVGFVSFVNSTKTPFMPHEHRLVARAHVVSHTCGLIRNSRGRGIADALMRRADEHARESGLFALYDDVYECNARSQAFHEKCRLSSLCASVGA
jgi:ribosomal protein S18 acetylase RimI-like enzyme